VPARSERSRTAEPAARVPERTGTSRSDVRPDNSDGVRFRPRSSTDSGTSVRQRTQVTPSTASAEVARARAAARSAGNDRRTVRSQPTRTVTPRTTSPAPPRKGFAASPERSAPAARPNVSQPQATSRAAPSRASTPAAAPRSSAAAPASAPRAAPAPARQDRAAPSRSGSTSSSRRSREH
jgi:hypothetical protein